MKVKCAPLLRHKGGGGVGIEGDKGGWFRSEDHFTESLVKLKLKLFRVCIFGTCVRM